jgi:hypothetical protein
VSTYVNDILVYCEQDSIRLKYIVDELLESRASLRVHYTHSLQHFQHSEISMKLAYAAVKPNTNCIHIAPHGLLDQTEIIQQDIRVVNNPDWLHIFFSQINADLPFDIFSASFYLITRYEEYLPHTKDIHGRFDHVASIAYKNGFLKIPIIDHWVFVLVKYLEQHFDVTIKNSNRFRFISTIDVDYAYLYKGIGYKRWWRKFLKSAADFRLADMFTQLLVLVGLSKDPYDTYDYINEVNEAFTPKPLCFYLIGRSTHLDKNIKADSFHLKPLLRRLTKMFGVGIHPSYNSYNSAKLITLEKKLLQQKSSLPIVISRQHYLRFSIPHTFHILEQTGITDDYSMGYANSTGFRASTCKRFLFFNLQINKPGSLIVHPICMMDTTLRYAMKLTPDEAIHEAEQLMQLVKKYGGDCILIWHNSSLSDIDHWKPWRIVYQTIHQQALKL